MLKNSNGPILCCGKLYKSGNYHHRMVHQQYTRVYFKDHPGASFILNRNPETQRFHCPHCDRAWPLATSARTHIYQQCEGYSQYRQSSGTIKIKPLLTTSQQQKDDIPDQVVLQGETSIKDEPVERSPPTVAAELPQVPERGPSIQPPAHPTAIYHQSPEPGSPTASDTGSIDAPPVLRPVVWGVADVKPSLQAYTYPPPPRLTNVASSSFSSLRLTSGASSSVPSSVSSPSSSVSSPVTSISSATSCTTGSVSVSFDGDLKFSPDTQTAPNSTSTANASSSEGGSSSPSAPSAAQIFLDSLRRPLGHAAPRMHILGLVTDADLDLVCTMPDAWDELGDLLRSSGMSVIEWLMVKEAFKARAKKL